MLVELTRDAEGPQGIIPAGTVINDPMAYLHIVNGIAKAADDEAEQAATIEKLRAQARARRKREMRQEQRKADREREQRRRTRTEERIRENLRIKLEEAERIVNGDLDETADFGGERSQSEEIDGT